MSASVEMTDFQSPPNCTVGRFTDYCIVQNVQNVANDLVSMKTIKHRILNAVMAEMEITPSDFLDTLTTHSPVHPEVAAQILRWNSKVENLDSLMAQDFVRNDKLLKLLRGMCRNGLTNIAHGILAMDGFGGSKLGLELDCKYYLENLRYSLTGEPGMYDREADDDMKLSHVCAVRKMYEHINQFHSENEVKYVHIVYQVLANFLKEVNGMEVPVPEIPIPEDILSSSSRVYREEMPKEMFDRWVRMIESKMERPTTEREDSGRVPHRKRTKMNPDVEPIKLECSPDI